MDQCKCRLCNENIGVTSLFDSIHELQLSAKVMYCAQVKIVQGDGLPANICTCCCKSLIAAYQFILKCEETDQKLRALQISLKQDPEIKCDIIKSEGSDNDVDNCKFASENIFDDTCKSLSSDDIKVEKDLKPLLRIKRKYVKRSNRKKVQKKCDPIKCKVCGRMCNNKSTFDIHMRSHTNEKPFTCHSCDKRYKDGGTLKRHIERNHEDGRKKAFICEHCGKGFYTKGDCKIHCRIHTGETPYACPKCPAQFTQVSSLQRHKLTHTGERPHMCSKCSKNFPTKEQLKAHYLVHTDEKKFMCPICSMPFKFNNNMRKHIRTHTSGLTKKFTCNDCGHSFTCKGNLKGHIKSQHSTKSGYCSHCSKHVSNMEMHTWKHAGLRPIKCELCPSTFFDLKGLSTHVSFRHKSVGKFKCPHDCDLTFPIQPMLDYHVMRYHKEIKPFSCELCPRRFYRKSDMVRHQNGSHKGVQIPKVNSFQSTACPTESSKRRLSN